MNKNKPKVAVDLPARAVMQCVAGVEPQEITWLWKFRFAVGKVSMLVGDPGLFKSGLALAIAATITRGAPWPDNSGTAPLGDVILLSAEDDIADTIRPRLDAAGADVSKVHVLMSVMTPDAKRVIRTRTFSLADDLLLLEDLLKKMPNVRLVIIDPISAYLGGGLDSHNNSEVRAVLAPLADLTARRRVAVLVVSHLNKGGQSSAIYRASGSLAFVAAARSVYLITRNPDAPAQRLFLVVKNNLAPEMPGLAYTITESENGGPMIAWLPDPVDLRADDALLQSGGDDFGRELKEATDWLRQQLRDGPVEVKIIQQAAKASGISARTLIRAKAHVGARSDKDGHGGWSWVIKGQGCQIPLP
jgi:hypothetical protein